MHYKYHAINTPDDILMHLHGPFEGRRRDLHLFHFSNKESNQQDIFLIDGRRYMVMAIQEKLGGFFCGCLFLEK